MEFDNDDIPEIDYISDEISCAIIKPKYYFSREDEGEYYEYSIWRY